MMLEQFFLIQAALALALLPFIFYRVYRAYRIDVLRHRLFVARDDLFNEWAATGRAFTDPAYMVTRYTLNGMLRWAHTLAMTHFLFAAFHQSEESQQIVAAYNSKKMEAFAHLDEEGRQLLEEAVWQAQLAVFSHLIHTSLPTFVGAMFMRIARPGISLSSVLKRTKTSAGNPWPEIDAIAEASKARDKITFRWPLDGYSQP